MQTTIGPLALYYDKGKSPGMEGDERFYVEEAEAAGSPVL